MKLEDYRKNVSIYDMEVDRLTAELTSLDPSSDAYAKALDALKKLNENKLLEEKAYAERKNGFVPDWVPKMLSVFVTGGLGVMIYRGELAGKVVGSAAVSMLNKLKF